ncbi:hypothetical protein ABE021_10170 [Sporosarcina gallistercoris]|uniref:hypothetical protein n=1 Tax=Sporosarcina gallistercoris TaxID=2762245 RepID=UPI003D283619
MKLPVTKETKDAMWQFFYKTSIPRLIAAHKKKERAELEARGPGGAEEKQD